MTREPRQRIPLDNAATSWPKPESVYQAVDDYQRTIGAPFARGGYDAAIEVQSAVNQCRAMAARLLGVAKPERVIFTFNATDSLNLAIFGLLRPGDHVVTSALEHNSISRPLRALEQRGTIELTRLIPEDGELLTVEQVKAACRPHTKLICLLHASNVTGTIQPIEAIGDFARERGIRFLVDAAQTAGVLPLSFDDLPVDLLACAGHKGLLGPLGTGLLCLAQGLEAELEPIRMGGTGTLSELDVQPHSLPDRYESGNHNVSGLYGLRAGLQYLLDRGVRQIRDEELALMSRLRDELKTLSGIRVHGCQNSDRQIGVLSISSELYEPHTLATLLAQEYGIETRAGLHCAPGMHTWLGTKDSGGTVRMSSGPFTAPEQIDSTIRAMGELHKV